MTLSLALALFFNVVMATVCLFAFWRGGRPERLGATINLVASTLSTGLRLSDFSFYAPSSIVMLSIDVAVALSFFGLAVRTTRFWPIWAFGFALAGVLMSIAGTLLPTTPLFAFHTGLGFYAYFALAALALGTYRLPKDATAEQRRGDRSKWEPPNPS